MEDYVRLFPERHNLQCRLIAGGKDTAIADERLLDTAKENLTKSFSVVGISEQFEESLILIATTFNWQIPFYKNCKVSKARPQIDPGTAALIRDHNRLDVELYEFGKKLFAESLYKRQDAVREGLTALRAIPRPGRLANFCQASLVTSRFLLSKIASAI